VQDLVARRSRRPASRSTGSRPTLIRLKAHPRFPGMEVERTEAVLVAGLLGQKGERSLILNGHVDVVPVGDRQAGCFPLVGHIQAGRIVRPRRVRHEAGLAVGIRPPPP